MIEFVGNKIKKLKNPFYVNSLYITLSYISSAISGFIFWNIATRFYSSQDVGVASTVISALNLVIMLSLLGMDTSLIRFYPEYKERAMDSSVAVVFIGSFLFSIAYIFFASVISGRLEFLLERKIIFVFVSFSIIGGLFNILGTFLIGLRKGKLYFIENLLFSFRFVFLLVLIPFSVLGIVVSFGLGLLLGLIFALLIVGLRVTPFLDLEYIKFSFKFSAANYLSNILNIFPIYIMPTIILSVLGKTQAAYYYIAFTIGNIFLFVPKAINTSFFVEGSHGKELGTILKKSLLSSYIYLVPLVLVISFFGKYILGVFGREYINGFSLLKLIAFSSFFVILFDFSITILNIKKKVKWVCILNLMKAIIFLGGSYLLIPTFGIKGIGYAWLITYLCLTPATAYITLKELVG